MSSEACCDLICLLMFERPDCLSIASPPENGAVLNRNGSLSSLAIVHSPYNSRVHCCMHHMHALLGHRLPLLPEPVSCNSCLCSSHHMLSMFSLPSHILQMVFASGFSSTYLISHIICTLVLSCTGVNTPNSPFLG